MLNVCAKDAAEDGRMEIRILARWAFRVVATLLAIAAVLAAFVWWRMQASLPILTGSPPLASLAAPVIVARDTNGVATLTGRNRADLARALGYLHGQERFFQMDFLRRASAGRLSELVGSATEGLDRKLRVHRFGARAEVEWASMTSADRAVLQAYADGINAGLGALRAAPFEYALLRSAPEPWRPQDSVLVTYAMYLDLQGTEPKLQLARARATSRLGRPMADLLYPETTELDSPIDGSRLPEPAMPTAMLHPAPAPARTAMAEPPLLGSNAFGVSGAHSATGAAMIANDMHLGFSVPNIWYRARLRMPGLDITGVTLPGGPWIIVGSNGKIAWGFTNSYADLHDAVAIDPVPGAPERYRVPGGERPLRRVVEQVCVRSKCKPLTIEETIWGPVVGRLPDGRRVADRWVAHDVGAVDVAPFLALEHAGSVAEALALAHRVRQPNQNFVVGDAAGHLAWTVNSRLPNRFGMTGRDAESWADGARGWRGYLAADAVPVVLDPPGGRVWTANARVVGGTAYRLIGDGGDDTGARAERIHKGLMAADKLDERAMLAIERDVQSDRNRFWQAEMLAALARQHDPAAARLIAPVRAWDGRAAAASVGYRLIARFRRAAIQSAFDAYVGPTDDLGRGTGRAIPQSDGAVRRLLRARPVALVPPGYAGWDAFEAAALRAVLGDVHDAAGGDLARYTWGGFMRPEVHHPLARAIPALGVFLDPPNPPVDGDSGVPQAMYPGGGPSERMVVSPGHEARGIFHMPGGQAGDPLSPYYLAGHKDWLEGRAMPFLPGPAKWTMTLTPAAR